MEFKRKSDRFAVIELSTSATPDDHPKPNGKALLFPRNGCSVEQVVPAAKVAEFVLEFSSRGCDSGYILQGDKPLVYLNGSFPVYAEGLVEPTPDFAAWIKGINESIGK